jgi:hypothetical protein
MSQSRYTVGGGNTEKCHKMTHGKEGGLKLLNHPQKVSRVISMTRREIKDFTKTEGYGCPKLFDVVLGHSNNT